MSDWPRYNPDRHTSWPDRSGSHCWECKTNCFDADRCDCCVLAAETERADDAEATVQRVREYEQRLLAWVKRSPEMGNPPATLAEIHISLKTALGDFDA